MKKPSVPKCLGGSQKIFLGCSTSSLAVFYVEQVALNRHVRRHFRLLFLCALPPDMSSQKILRNPGQELTVAKQDENAHRGLTKKKAAVEAGRQILSYGFRRGAVNALQRRSLSR